jgi:signal transduction histidine kinase
VRFRYRLWGFDSSWQDAHGDRQAFYQNLAPGKYVFQVLAANNDGLWNELGDRVMLIVPPAFYQTIWFRCATVTLGLVFLWLIIRLREMKTVRIVQAKMSERLMERDRIARELHDTLLQGFQSIIFRLDTIWKKEPHDPSAEELFTETLARADAVLGEGRAKVRLLRREGDACILSEAIRSCIQELDVPETVRWQIEILGREEALPPIVCEEMCAIAKESVVNALRHAHATSIACTLQYTNKCLKFECRDNGVGIPNGVLAEGNRTGHYGLVGMRERAEKIKGVFKIELAEIGGATVRVIVPGRIAFALARNRSSVKAAISSLFSKPVPFQDR